MYSVDPFLPSLPPFHTVHVQTDVRSPDGSCSADTADQHLHPHVHGLLIRLGISPQTGKPIMGFIVRSDEVRIDETDAMRCHAMQVCGWVDKLWGRTSERDGIIGMTRMNGWVWVQEGGEEVGKRVRISAFYRVQRIFLFFFLSFYLRIGLDGGHAGCQEASFAFTPQNPSSFLLCLYTRQELQSRTL